MNICEELMGKYQRMRRLSMRRGKRGMSLAVVVIIMVVLAIAGLSMLSMGRYYRLHSFSDTDRTSARLAADAGVSRALSGMNQKIKVKPWSSATLPTGTEMLPQTNSGVTYTVGGDLASGFSVSSVGTCRNATKKIKATLRLAGLFDYGMYVKSGIELKNGVYVDGYNYAPDDPGLKIGTLSTLSSTVNLRSDATVDGQVLVGFGGDPDDVVNMQSGASATDGTYAMAQTWFPPDVPVPDYLVALPSQGTLGGATTVATSVKYNDVHVPAYETVTIDGPVEMYILGNLILEEGAEMRIVDAATNPNASLTIYVTGDIEGKNSSALNNLTNDAHKLTIYGLPTCDRIQLKNSGQFYGTIYAPYADVVFHNSLEMFGALVANSFTQMVAADFHYDASLGHVGINDAGAHFVIERWEEE